MRRQIEEALNEPECEHNHKNMNSVQKSCLRSKPGEAAGGCSFDGAQVTLVPIADVAHLVHGPIACLGNSFESRGSLSSGPSLYKYGFTTDIGEEDIIFGGEKKLLQAIQEIIQQFHPSAIFVYSTCVTALTGEDIDSICKQETQRSGTPVIPINSPGFVGSKNMGSRLAGEALFQHVIGTEEPPETTPYDINIIGEYNISGELWDIMPLLDQAGIRVLSRISGDGRFAQLRWAHRAKLNMVVCSRALISLARKMKERYNIPYFEGSFYGAKETTFALRQIAFLLNDRQMDKKVDRITKMEEETLYQELVPYRKILNGKRAVLYTGGVKSWSVISALQELGMKVVAVGTNKSTQEDIARIRERVGDDIELIDSDGSRRILKAVRERKADIIIAGGRNMYVALKEQIPFLDINQERHTAYAGYVGLKRLARDLVHAIQHPIWKLTRLAPPWEGEQPYGR